MAKKAAPDLLAVLKGESDTLALKIAACMERKTQVDALIATYEGKPKQAPKREPVRKQRATSHARGRGATSQKDGLFYGKALPEACTLQLKIAGSAQRAADIWAALSREGYVVTAANPNHAVHWSLRRREKTVGDVMVVGKGLWDLCERYSEAERERIRDGLGPMAARDHESHIAKTKRGIENSRANGVRWGAPILVTDEVKAKLVQLRLNEKMSVTEACASVGIAPATYYHRPDNGESAHQVVKKAMDARKAAQANERKKAERDLLSPVAGSA